MTAVQDLLAMCRGLRGNEDPPAPEVVVSRHRLVCVNRTSELSGCNPHLTSFSEELGLNYRLYLNKITHFVQVGSVRHPVHIAGQDFIDAIDRCGLPLKLDTPTQGDGNCWVRSVEQQLERPELEEQLNERTRQLLSVKKPKR